MSEVSDKFVLLYLNNLKERRIVYSECQECKQKSLPPLPHCPSCNSTTVELKEALHYGTIETYTIINIPTTNFEKEAPFAVGIIKLTEGIRIMARIHYSDPSELKIGEKVVAKFDIEKGDSSILSFKIEK
ncbi:MAG: Zn-ribbon domain-containing OB-fold protein [Candidatus Heimdallarchaeaceae archaeon]